MSKRVLKLIGTVIGIGILVFSLFYFLKEIETPIQIQKIPEVIQGTQPKPLKYLQKEISAPTPLTFPTLKETEIVLSNDEIIKFTNYYREEDGIERLEKDQFLMEAAKLKLDEMFQEQYFAHTSPEGKNAGDILEEIGYDYLVVGENLALGYFKDSKDLVDGWMGSPGHRENILNPKFKEIGVAQRKDRFQGKEQYLAVQIFAAPTSLCLLPGSSLLSQIQEEKEELEELISQADILKEEIEKETKGEFDTQEEVQQTQEKIKAYNKLVTRINHLSKELEVLISNYNLQVTSFNTCIDNF